MNQLSPPLRFRRVSHLHPTLNHGLFNRTPRPAGGSLVVLPHIPHRPASGLGIGMDKISKLRRKPKPPAIETSVDRSKSVEPPVEETSADSLHPGRLSRLSGRISPFRQIRFRTSPGKRARSSPPVGALPSSPMAAASSSVSVVQQDGVMPRVPRSRGRNGPSGAGTPRIPEFLTYSKTEIDNKYQDLTWAERNRVSESVRADTDESSKWFIFRQPQVAEKGLMDRYPNIRPWNYNRVKLQVAENELDYVNASDIILPEPTDESKKPLRYIAMQGPTEPSFNYVWRMVAEQLSPQASIVQLTSMLEGGFIKCHQYFPFTEEESTWNLNEEDIWGDGWKATLTFESLEEYADGAIEKRKLLLHVQGEEEPRVIWHFLFHCWPDFGVPDLGDLDSFFELMKLSREHSDPEGTRIIHCSAGVGRTGTFISIEHLLRELDSDAFTDREACPDNTDPVFDTVEELRQQRRGMVQGAVQFTFIYQVVRKLWQEKYSISDDRLRSGSEPASKRLEVPELLISDETDDDEMKSDDTDPASSEAGAARTG